MSDTFNLMLNDIQGILLSGYGHLGYSTLFFLRVTDPAAAKRWLMAIADETTNATLWEPLHKPTTCLNIAFSYEGVKTLGLTKDSLDSFPAELREGMADPLRAKRLGDVGASAPDQWEKGWYGSDESHMVLFLFTDSIERMISLSAQHRARFADAGLTESMAQEITRPPDNKEHFGFQDGIGQPRIEGAPHRNHVKDDGQPTIQPGEFIFGYPNEYGLLPPQPYPDQLGTNGSYMVYRKLAEDVGAFHTFLHTATDGSPEQMNHLGAKMMGRWQSGAPLVLTPDHDNPQVGIKSDDNNNFTFAEKDRYGYLCPVGSHIRRANPRDSLEDDPIASVLTSKRHRIVRRGRMYGSSYTPDTKADPRGIAFIAFNSDIRRQFEFIQETWLNDPMFNGLINDKDPITADRDPKQPTTDFSLQRDPFRKVVHDVPQFVTVRGGGYYFMPGIRALKFIAGE